MQPGRYSKQDTTSSSRYIENAVIAFEEFGDASGVLKCYEFKDKVRTSEKLRRNVLIKIEVSEYLQSLLIDKYLGQLTIRLSFF
jgi:hypothetical protein